MPWVESAWYLPRRRQILSWILPSFFSGSFILLSFNIVKAAMKSGDGAKSGRLRIHVVNKIENVSDLASPYHF